LPLPPAERKALWLLPVGHKDTVIAEWSIENDAESEDAANRRELVKYWMEYKGEPRDIIKKLRPVVETHMRRLAPQQFAGLPTLGSMLEKVRDDPTISPPLRSAYDDIDEKFVLPPVHAR